MAWSVECRTVFTDYRLVDLLSTVPSAMKYSDGREKYLLRQVAKKYIPDYIIERKKLGFPELPDGKAELVHEMIEQKLLTKSPVLNRLFDQKLLQYPEQLSLNMQWKLCSVALLELALL